MRQYSRVYFIGAGFTACQGYPVGRQLVGGLLNHLHGQKNAGIDNTFVARGATRDCVVALRLGIECALARFFGISSKDQVPVDVAEFYTVAQVLSRTPQLLGVAANDPLIGLYVGLSAATRTYFLDILNSQVMNETCKAILDRVKEHRDTHAVVSFNWDEEVDWWLSYYDRDDVAYTTGSCGDGDCLVLKPHGSMGWYDTGYAVTKKDSYCIADGDPRIPAGQPCRIMAYEEFEVPTFLSRRSIRNEDLECPPVITPPTFSKEFPYAEQQLIWHDVAEVCSAATEFVFLGYSLPPDDYITRAAIRKALARNGAANVRCLVVTREPSRIEANFRAVFDRIEFLDCDFGRERPDLAGRLEAKLDPRHWMRARVTGPRVRSK